MSELPSATTTSFQHAYGESTPFSIGVEEEFQLVDAGSYQLVPRVEEVLGQASDGELLHIKQELMQSVVEIATPICTDAAHAEIELRGLRARVAELAEESGCLIASAGTHPFSRYELQKITDAQRYHDLIERLQWVAQRELIFGLHVHVGMRSPDQAMYVFNHIRRYLPELLALSANSPYWQGRDTGLASSRSKVFDGFPRSGIPPRFENWDAWERLMRRAMAVGAIDDYTYIWWDVRPHPKFGTIEVRVCDAQTRLEDTLGIAALIQGIAAWLGDEYDRGVQRDEHPTFLIAENKWSAARYGLAGSFIDFDADASIPTRDAVERLIERARPYADACGSGAQLRHLDGLLSSGGGAARQRAWRAEGTNIAHVAERIARATWPA